MRPTVSVVVPAYNHARYVGEAIYSALAQTRAPDELIVVDDGSTDLTPDVLQAFVDLHPNVVCWRQPNRGAHAAINAAVQRSSGDLVAVLNSDDAFEPDRLEAFAALFEARPEVCCACSGVTFVDAAGDRFEDPWYERGCEFARTVDDVAVALAFANIAVTTSNIVVRRSAFEQIGGFANLRYAHDLEFLLRFTRHGSSLAWIDRPLVNYRVHARNTVKEAPDRVQAEVVLVLADQLSRVAEAAPAPQALAKYLPALREQGLVEAVLVLLPHFTRQPLALLTRERYEALMSLVVQLLARPS